MPSIRFVFTRSAISWRRLVLLTSYGISVMTISSRPLRSRISALPRIRSVPRPVS